MSVAEAAAPSASRLAALRGTIALEEHLVPDLESHRALWRSYVPMMSDEAVARTMGSLTEVGERRLAAMDAAGIELAVLSNVGNVQPIPDASTAEAYATQANDYLAEVVAQRPDRFAAFATVAMQDPVHGADELERAVTQLGMKGAMIFGPTVDKYPDHTDFDPFWERAAALAVPIYLHPSNPIGKPVAYEGRPELAGAIWSWTVETATQFLRMIFAGTFDRHPSLQVILGHAGETLPYLAWRLDSRAKAIGWSGADGRLPSDYLRSNLLITMSGVFDDAPLRCAIDTIGLDRVLFSLDYPFEAAEEAREWLEHSTASDEEIAAVAHGNARRVLFG